MGGAAPVARGGKRSLDAALNLVPFIDLLSCCIAFLLITACWSQLAHLPASHAGAGDSEHATPSERPTVTVGADGYVLELGGAAHEIPRARGAWDVERLAQLLRGARPRFPDDAGVSLRARDDVPYAEVVRAMDAILGARFVAIDLDGLDGA
jgi:biopolymer transport protein ExbD